MELGKQVVSLELAKRMKGLGFEQRSIFYHVKREEDGKELVLASFTIGEGNSTGSQRTSRVASAYTVAELGEIIPRYCPEHGEDLNICPGRGRDENKFWIVGYGYHQGLMGCHVEIEETEADARAKMLIYLKENNLLK